MKKKFIVTICTATALLGSVAAAAPGQMTPPELSPPTAGSSPYRVLSSRRVERDVQPGVVRQTGSLSLSVGSRGKHAIHYDTEQKFLPGGGASTLKLVDLTAKAKASFTLSEDGSRASFAVNDLPTHNLEVNPDETYTFDGVTYSSEAEAVAAVVQSGCIPGNALELLAGAIEISNTELHAVNKGEKGKKVGIKICNFFIAVFKAIKELLV